NLSTVPRRNANREPLWIVVRELYPLGFFITELLRPTLHEPPWVRCFDTDFLQRVSRLRGRIVVRFSRSAPQHGVYKSCGRPEPRCFDQVDGFVDRGGRGNARKKSQLIKPEPQRERHRQVERIHFACSEMFQRSIQPQPAAQDSEHEFMT